MSEPHPVERARGHGDAIAVRSGSSEHSYRALLERSGNVAVALLGTRDDLGESRVAYMLPTGFEHVAVQWGILRAGGVAVPLSLSAAEPELEYALTDSGSSCVVTTRDLRPALADLCTRLEIPTVIVDDVPDDRVAEMPDVDGGRRAMMLYTSGTTSRPKGVVSTHDQLRAQIESLVEAWQWRADDRIPLFLPLHHIHGIVNVMSCALWSGATIEPFTGFDVREVTNRVAAGAYTVFMAVPTIYVKLIGALEGMSADEAQPVLDGFRDLRLMVSGSAALPASVHERWTELTGQSLLERYGMTEIGMALSNPYVGERRPGAVGLPLPGVDVRLVTESGEVVTSDGVPGEIQVRGPGVFREYWNQPETTADAFEDGWFRTGDVAVLEQGYYRIMGRSSVDIVKSGGYKLSALEIEATLLDHPSIEECAVVGLPDDVWGEIVAVAVVPSGDDELDLESLGTWSRNRLSKYKVPRRLVQVDALPRNAMGKVVKPAVADLFEEATSDEKAVEDQRFSSRRPTGADADSDTPMC